MEYTVQKLAALAGVTARTLRYYDQIGLLSPTRISSSGYRIYGTREVDRLQQICFYREMDMSLEEIGALLGAENYDPVKALEIHLIKLQDKKSQLERLIGTVEKTIAHQEGRIMMSDQEKFEGFKEKLIKDNETKYGQEVRKKYGNQAVDASNKKVLEMSQEDHDKLTALSQELHQKLIEATRIGDVTSPLAMEVCDLHRQWLSFYWDHYSKEYHVGLAQMYVADDRFKAHYEAICEGAADFICGAIHHYTGL